MEYYFLLFLSVNARATRIEIGSFICLGPDVAVWNLHRRYGSVRLSRLLDGWKTGDVVGWFEEKLTEAASWRQTYEPVFVLKNTFV